PHAAICFLLRSRNARWRDAEKGEWCMGESSSFGHHSSYFWVSGTSSGLTDRQPLCCRLDTDPQQRRCTLSIFAALRLGASEVGQSSVYLGYGLSPGHNCLPRRKGARNADQLDSDGRLTRS